jgi:hypothetical protein
VWDLRKFSARSFRSKGERPKDKFWTFGKKKNLEGVAGGSVLGGNIAAKPNDPIKKVLTKYQQTI